MRLPSDLNRALVGFYRGWDRLEREQFNSSVIDFDLAEPAPALAFESREAVARELTRLEATIGDAEGPAADLSRARLRASSMYLRGLKDLDSIPFREYVLETMGIEPAPMSEARIAASAVRVRNLLREYRGGEVIPFSRHGFDAFRAEFQTGTGDNLVRQFEYFCGKWIPVLTRAIEADLDLSSIVVEFAEEDAYWKNWISGNLAEGEPIKLRINVHERHVWYQGAVEILVLHEYCGHAVQMALWQEAVRREEISSFFGVLTVHFPDQFLVEGLAESVAHVLPDERDRRERRPKHELERRSEIIRELQTYNLLILNNVHILANEKGVDVARTYARQRLPFTSFETIERELRDRTRHPLFRTYQYVYGPAQEAFVGALEPLPAAAKWRALQKFYRTPMTPAVVRASLAASGA
ncbi:MAG: hypothetical protein ABJC89_03135 [Acidobacteriota bacterium]